MFIFALSIKKQITKLSAMKKSEFTIINKVSYKGHIISHIEDGFQQDFAIIDDNKKELYASVSDAKRVINGLQPKYEVI